MLNIFKPIPGNKELRINLRRKLISLDGSSVEIPVDKAGKVSVELFGKMRRVELKWLSLFAWYECGVIENLAEHWNKIAFYPASHLLRTRCGHIMQFKEPVFYKEGFRYIPNHPRYAIDINGVVIDTVENKFVETMEAKHGYVDVYIYTPDRCANRHVRHHRVAALAWLHNTDFINRPLINHIDSNRTNNSLNNLEWCNSLENSQHAVRSGNYDKYLVKMKTRDAVTGEVKVFSSVSELSRFLGVMIGGSSFSCIQRLPGHLYKQRYEVKRLDDDSPWYYENRELDENGFSKQYYTIDVLDKKTGERKVFIQARDFKNFCKIYSIDNVVKLVEEMKTRRPELEITLTVNVVQGPYRVIDIVSKKCVILNSIRESAEHIGKNKNELNADLRMKRRFIYDGRWVVLPNGVEFNNEDFKHKTYNVVKVEIEDVRTKEKFVAKSLSEAQRVTRIGDRVIRKRLDIEKPFKNYIFRSVE